MQNIDSSLPPAKRLKLEEQSSEISSFSELIDAMKQLKELSTKLAESSEDEKDAENFQNLFRSAEKYLALMQYENPLVELAAMKFVSEDLRISTISQHLEILLNTDPRLASLTVRKLDGEGRNAFGRMVFFCNVTVGELSTFSENIRVILEFCSKSETVRNFKNLMVDLDYLGASAFHEMVTRKMNDLLYFCINKQIGTEARFSVKTHDNLSLLEYLIYSDNFEAIKFLHLAPFYNNKNNSISLRYHLNLGRYLPHKGRTSLLHLACQFNKPKLFHQMDKDSQHQALNSLDYTGDTPLRIAAKSGSLDMVKLLLTNPSLDVNAEDIENETAFYLAVQNNHIDVIEALLNDQRCIPQKMHTLCPLGHAAFIDSVNVETFKFLLNHPRISPDIITSDMQQNVFLECCLSVNPTKLSILLNHPRITVSHKTSLNKKGSNALHLLLPTILDTFPDDGEKCFKLLLSTGLYDVHHVNNDGDNLLHIAIELSNNEILEFILPLGINPFVKNSKGSSALDLALQHYPETAEIMTNYSAAYQKALDVIEENIKTTPDFLLVESFFASTSSSMPRATYDQHMWLKDVATANVVKKILKDTELEQKPAEQLVQKA